MKTIKFNLERAKDGDPILLNGAPATFGAHNPDASEFCKVVAWDSGGYAWAVSDQGSSQHGGVFITMAPKKRVVWVNMFPLPSDASGFQTKKEADNGAGVCRIACVRVEFEEGEGL